MSNNLQRLGAELASRMKKTAGAAVPVTVELGTINQNLSLSVDSLNTPIPKGDYMVNLIFAAGEYETSSSYGVDGHSHRLPSVFRALKPGDRVLVVWCGFEPVVTCVITKS